MIVRRLTLRNWKNFTSFDIPFGMRTFLVGPNAAGKSNLLDAFRFLADLTNPTGGGLQEAIARRGGLSKVRCLFARRPSDVQIAITVGDPDVPEKKCWRYELTLQQEERGKHRPIVKSECVTKPNGQIAKHFNRPDQDDKKDAERLTQTALEQRFANAEVRELAQFLSSFSYLHLVPQLIKNPEYFRSVSIPGDPFGNSFLDKVAKTPEKYRRSRLSRIERVLQIMVPRLESLTFEQEDGTGKPHLSGKYQNWRKTPAYQNEVDFSDGTLRIIALLWQMQSESGPLLLEEPELSLNPGVIKAIPRALHAMQKEKGRQVIISTHSSDLLSDQSIGANEVVMMQPSDEATYSSLAVDSKHIVSLLESGEMTPGEVILPKTAPRDTHAKDGMLHLWK